MFVLTLLHISLITFLFVEIQELLEPIRDNFGMILDQDNFTFGNQLEAASK
jgi:hypothetical protein